MFQLAGTWLGVKFTVYGAVSTCTKQSGISDQITRAFSGNALKSNPGTCEEGQQVGSSLAIHEYVSTRVGLVSKATWSLLAQVILNS